MWETVRETTLASSAPTLVYEEGSLIKRAIRDLYSKEVEEITVAGEAGYREARQFMRLLMPSHVNSVQLYRDTAPVFAKAGVESQLDAMFSNQVTLKSGGYIVINQTEALVAIDVNSGRSTREHNIEDTALRTNLEAADEIARQLRLRDLAGLIVVDFIDMEESRNNRAVERRIKDALKNDRARIQVGRISHFGLLEMSRQRIRTGVLEGSTVICPHCQGAGVVRSTASIALHVLRVLEDALIKSSTHDLTVRTRTPVALYILNQKRVNLRDLERRFGVAIVVEADDTLTGANYHAIERGEPATGVKSEGESAKSVADDIAPIIEETAPVEAEDDETFEARDDENEEVARLSDHGSGALAGGKRGRPSPPPPPPPPRRALVRRQPLAQTPHSRRTTAWQSSPKSAAISLRRAARLTPSTEEVHAAERSVTVDREVRAASEIGSDELMERPRPRRPRQDSIRPPRSRLSKNSPRRKQIIPLPRLSATAFLTTDAMANPAPGRCGAGAAEPRTASAAGAEPTFEPPRRQGRGRSRAAPEPRSGSGRTAAAPPQRLVAARASDRHREIEPVRGALTAPRTKPSGRPKGG